MAESDLATHGDISVKEVEVGSADPRGGDLDDCRIRPQECGIWCLDNSNRPAVIDHHVSHVGSFRSGPVGANLGLYCDTATHEVSSVVEGGLLYAKPPRRRAFCHFE